MTAEGSRPEPTVHVIDDDEAVQRKRRLRTLVVRG